VVISKEIAVSDTVFSSNNLAKKNVNKKGRDNVKASRITRKGHRGRTHTKCRRGCLFFLLLPQDIVMCSMNIVTDRTVLFLVLEY